MRLSQVINSSPQFAIPIHRFLSVNETAHLTSPLPCTAANNWYTYSSTPPIWLHGMDSDTSIFTCITNIQKAGQDSSWYSNLLSVGRFADQILVGMRYSIPIQTGPAARTASYTMGTGSFQGLSGQGMASTPYPNLSGKVKERVVIPLLPLPAFMACSRVKFNFTNIQTE